MPLYEYECQQCRRHTEKRQKFSDPEITDCPHCGGHLQRVITAPAIAFKGGGWYADGYGNAKPKASGEANASGDKSPSGEGKTGETTSQNGGQNGTQTSGQSTSSGESSGSGTAAPAASSPAPSTPASPAPSSAKS